MCAGVCACTHTCLESSRCIHRPPGGWRENSLRLGAAGLEPDVPSAEPSDGTKESAPRFSCWTYY